MRVSRRAGVRMGGGGLGIVVLALVAMYFGVDPAIVLQGAGMGGEAAPSSQQTNDQPSAQDKELSEFVSIVLADTEDTWNEPFPTLGQRYEEPRLVLFSGVVQSACGTGQAAMGPFYCPGDKSV